MNQGRIGKEEGMGGSYPQMTQMSRMGGEIGESKFTGHQVF